jgi:hypothetical protein
VEGFLQAVACLRSAVHPSRVGNGSGSTLSAEHRLSLFEGLELRYQDAAAHEQLRLQQCLRLQPG